MENREKEYRQLGSEGFVQVFFNKGNGGFLTIHPHHGQNEWEENKRIGRLLAELGDAIILLPNQPEKRSCDALRNGEEWEFKTVNTERLARGIQDALRRGKLQSPRILCLVRAEFFHPFDIALGVYNAVKFDQSKHIEQVSILFPSGRLIEMHRQEVLSAAYFSKIFP